MDDVAVLAALADDSRRGMYEYVRRRGAPVTRDEAAQHVGISRKLAAFHLEKLVDVGLLRVTDAPRAGPRGPGRTPKAYEPSGVEIAVSVPPRRVDVVAEVLADAVARSEDATTFALEGAHARGVELGEAERRARGVGRTGSERALHLASGVLETLGAEPYRTDSGSVRLRNCPFHPLAERRRELVCGLNRAMVDGLLRGLGNETVEARLAPAPGECCVELVPGSRTPPPEATA